MDNWGVCHKQSLKALKQIHINYDSYAYGHTITLGEKSRRKVLTRESLCSMGH